MSTTFASLGVPEPIAAALADRGITEAFPIQVATIPPGVLRQLFNHPLTDKGLETFLADWASTGQSILDS